jgi:FKBP-type peptidyl-prolyl cis-trans isomerase
MKHILYPIIISSILWTGTTSASNLKTPKQKQGYALGHNIGLNLERQGIVVDFESFYQGLKDSMHKAKPKISETEIKQALQALSESSHKKQEKASQGQREANEKEGKAYMAENKKDKKVKQTKSGLQYKIIRLGKGKKPKATDRVKVHYAGNFIDGSEFDSSYKRGQPSTFGLNQVIPGWTEVLQLMPVGSKFKVAIPGNLAYGNKAPPSIGPNRTLLFDIELIAIE